MKKISRTIAMILVLVMLASSFTSCTLMFPLLWEDGGGEAFLWGGLIDILLVALVLVLIGTPSETETQIYMVGAENNPLTLHYSLMERINSLHEAEMDSVMTRLNSLPVAKRAALVDTVYSLPWAEIASSTERLNALSDTELASQLRAFSDLSNAEFDLLLNKLNERARFLSVADYIAAADDPKERAYMALSLQY